jgi:DNA polymerase-1
MSEVKEKSLEENGNDSETPEKDSKTHKLNKKHNSLILIDGHALAFRAYHALARMGFRTKDGTPTWAAFGFSKILFEIIEKFKPHYMIVTFDTSAPTFRKEMYEGYKANRTAAPDDFVIQMPMLTEIVNAFEIPIFQKPGFEADDLIGTLARQASEQGLEVGIVTGDRDLLQLVNEHVTVYLPHHDQTGLRKYDVAETIEKYGIRPDQIVDYKGMVGDTSDNIPGIKGMGPKGAAKLLQEFETLDNIYNNLDKIDSKRVRGMLEDNKEIAMLSRTLSRIEVEAPIEFNLESCHLNRPVEENVREVFTRLEFKSMLSTLPKLLANFLSAGPGEEFSHKEDDDLWFDFNEEEHSQSDLKLDVNIVKTIDEVKELVNTLQTLPFFSIDLETTSVNSLLADIVGISIAHDKDIAEKKAANFKIFYIPTGHILEEDPIKNLVLNDVLSVFKPLLENGKVLKIGQNLKYEMNVFSRYGIDLCGVKDDTFIADYLINPSTTHALKEIAKSHLHYFMTNISELIGSGKNAKTMDQVLTSDAAQYAGADSAVTLELSYFLRDKLAEADLTKLYEEMELPLVKVLARMEQNGINIDKKHLNDLSDKLKEMLGGLEKKIYELAGKEFNINSPKQLSIILFEDMQIPVKGVKKNKTTGFSTDASVLEKLAAEYEIVRHILEYRTLAKVKSTYADSLPHQINPKTGKIHTSYNQTIASTGRLSSIDPNLQNIPIKTEIGREIRRAFITSDPDDVILTADYSQIELRLLAHYTKDPIFIEAFEKDLDIHSRTVMDVFGLKDISEVTPELRRIGKTVNFGIIYGQSAFGLAEKLKIPNKQAAEIISKFNETYKSINKYVDEMVNFADKNGYVKTLFDRRRYLPEIHSSIKSIREFGKRTAINTPLQGTAADLIKIAMIRVDQALIEKKLKTKMLLQVHDELVFEVPKNEVAIVKEMITGIMENVYPEISVPLKVSVNTGTSWVEAK